MAHELSLMKELYVSAKKEVPRGTSRMLAIAEKSHDLARTKNEQAAATYHSVVDVGGPHAGEEKQADVSEVVDGQNEQTNHIRRRLRVTMKKSTKKNVPNHNVSDGTFKTREHGSR